MVEKTAQFIIRVPFDERTVDGLEQTPTWCRYRIKVFEELTLRSLLNQTFQNFRIFLLCGPKNRNIKDTHSWHPRVELCYDMGRSIYETLEADYAVITRIDSDDLMHKDALAEIRDNLIFSQKRECLIFRKHWLWQMAAGYLMRRTYYDPAPPYYTHIIPREIFRNWEEFDIHHNVGHGHAGGMLPETKELSPLRIVVVKHWGNTGRLKRNKPLVTKGNPRNAINNREKMSGILADFGIQPAQLATDYKIN